jgi:hypothetical protein
VSRGVRSYLAGKKIYDEYLIRNLSKVPRARRSVKKNLGVVESVREIFTRRRTHRATRKMKSYKKTRLEVLDLSLDFI